HWREPNLGRYPLSLDVPPDQGRFSQILHQVGAAARDANRVEVPFEFIAPKPDQYWTFDTSKGVDIPLGRAGATKLQHLRLGKGTSQHALTSGKTGSGKSTMLHALITNGALRYSPDELELYLIDFKKGVEFKVYAAMELPHARVIAVESEREFGLSVLQRLDGELKARGDRFRDLGVQDLASYRAADGGKNPLPRILFIVDEFQEFFVEYLKKIHGLAVSQGRPPVSQIVFEGNLPAVASKNPLLAGLIETAGWPEPPKADYAWLGEAIAIKDPTAAVFRPQSGSNLLIVGQKDAAALGMMSLILVSIAAQHPPADPAHPGSGVKFSLCDGSPVDSPNNGK